MANTYVFRQVAYITLVVEAENDESAYEKVSEIDPLTGDIDYEEPEIESIEDENGNMRQFELYDNISEFIHNFEENKKKKKAKKAEGLEQFLDDELE